MQIDHLDVRSGATLPFPFYSSAEPSGEGRAAAREDASRIPVAAARDVNGSGRVLPCKFGRYTLFDRIGQGGMADIYLARIRTDLGASRLVVIKEVTAKLANNERFAEMLAGEAKLAAELRHAAVVQVEDLGREGDALFIAMEYVEGLDLRELLRRCARQKVKLPVEFSLLMVCEVLRALVYAHRNGVVHRDVSPSNVLLSFEGEIKLCDFGISRATELCDLPAEEALQGKAGYMSPEHARGGAVDARSDVFAVGILLWELLSGRRLYHASRSISKEEARDELLDQAQRGEVPPLPSRGLPDEVALHAIVARATAKNRDDRYPTASAMLRDLAAYAARANLAGNPLRFGAWLRESFGTDIVTTRRARERAVRALELGPPAVIQPIAPPPAATPEHAAPTPAATPPHQEDAPAPAAFLGAAPPEDEPSPWSRRASLALAPASRAVPAWLVQCGFVLALVAAALTGYLAAR